jgi:hypothetical protein
MTSQCEVFFCLLGIVNFYNSLLPGPVQAGIKPGGGFLV